MRANPSGTPRAAAPGQVAALSTSSHGRAPLVIAAAIVGISLAVGLTSVAAAVVLVNTQPVIVALLSAVWLDETPARRQWIGIAIAMVGALIVALPPLRARWPPIRAH